MTICRWFRWLLRDPHEPNNELKRSADDQGVVTYARQAGGPGAFGDADR